MPRKRNQRHDPVIQHLDFDESNTDLVEGHDVEDKNSETNVKHRGASQDYNQTKVCPMCPCKAYSSDQQRGRFQNDCNCGSCAALNADEFDFSHRDRLRWVFYRDSNSKPPADESDDSKLHWLLHSLVLLLLIVTLLGFLLLLKWFLVEGIGHLTLLWVNFEGKFMNLYLANWLCVKPMNWEKQSNI